jgi:hypothetical protein
MRKDEGAQAPRGSIILTDRMDRLSAKLPDLQPGPLS